MDKLSRIIKESIKKVLDEGIDFDTKTMTVSYNPSHENNVDTSIENNPTNDDSIIPGVDVWSIFKRKRGNRDDGNPLVFALKGEGWTFRSEEDRLAIIRQFDAIATKFANMHPIGVTILVPSTNSLNDYIAKVVMSKSENAELIEGVIYKLTTEEIENMVQRFDSKFRAVYRTDFDEQYKKLQTYLNVMDEEKDGEFARHLIRDPKMRNAIDFTLKYSKDRIAEYANKINGQDVLLIDDNISRGQTISEAVDILRTVYAPKSITVLTLLSKKV